MFSELKRRYSQVPIHDPKYLTEIIPSLKEANLFREIEIWKLTDELNSNSKAEVLSQMALLQSHFNLIKCTEEVPDWNCFKIDSVR